MNKANFKCTLTLVSIGCVAAVAMSTAAIASVTQTIAPEAIDLGEAAQLTIAASGADASSITPPMVAGLEFVAVSQSQRIESINGATHATTSVTYQVIPRRAGVFAIPGGTASAAPVTLTVNDGNSGNGASRGRTTALPRGLPNTSAGAVTQIDAGGGAFVKLRVAKQDLYVGETIPVEIQVGTRDGVVASLNGQPTLNGDAFTLDKLSAQPQRTSEIIGGRPFTIFTWHSVLAAVKPGRLSLTMETPLTVRIRSAPRPDGDFMGGSDLDELLNDTSLQSFFGTTTEKDITVASAPATFAVQALPVQNRPADFSGAVGQFTVSSDVSDDKTAVGDPVTLRLHVSGSGNFNRVDSQMLHDPEHWKTYAPTAAFKPGDQIGYRGEKTFEQPVIATEAGAQALPALAFSWFDPATRRYVEARTSPLRIAVGPALAADNSTARGASSTPSLPPADAKGMAGTGEGAGLHPDQAENGSSLASLQPHYFETPYVIVPSTLALAFLSGIFWVRRRERAAHASSAAREREAALETLPLLSAMEEAAKTGDAVLFFRSAREAVARALASRWHVPPSNVTLEEAKTRLAADADVTQLFELADEARYSRVRLTAIDFKHWKQVVIQQMKGGQTS